MAPPPTRPAQGTDNTDTEAGSVTMWPPGTVLLEDFTNSASKKDIILHPRPTTDPNDPLNWSKGRKYLNFAIVCIYTAMVSEFTSSATPTWGPMQRELGHTDAQLNNRSLGSFLCHMYQPFILLATILAITYAAFVYGILVAFNDVMSTSIATYMKKPTYNFNSAQVGLMSMPRIIGITIGCVVGGPLSDWLVLFLSRRN
jgi:hypothetical protein